VVRVHAGPLKLLIGRLSIDNCKQGGLAQLARAPALQAGGHRFDSDILHNTAGQGSRKQSDQQEVLIRDLLKQIITIGRGR
jgi:hypothetical protein